MKQVAGAVLVLLVSFGAAFAQQKTIKDPAEYNAYVTAVNQTDPGARIEAMEQFLRVYPNSVVATDGLEVIMAAAQQKGDQAKLGDASERLLAREPNNLRALAVLTFVKRNQAQAAGGDEGRRLMQEAGQYGERGLSALDSGSKPENVSYEQYAQMKDQLRGIFEGAVGTAALQRGEYGAAQQHLAKAVELGPNNANDNYALALAYLTADQPDDAKGFWYLARSENLLSNAPEPARQIDNYGRTKYSRVYGSSAGWDALVAQTKTATTPPTTLELPKPDPQGNRLSADDIVYLLSHDVTPKRVATMVDQHGVDFVLDKDSEARIRQAGGDDALLVRIAVAHK